MKAIFYVILSLTAITATAQSVKQSDFSDLFAIKIKEYTRLDSSVNVNRLSSTECNLLIEKMYEVDQQYRDSLRRSWSEEPKQRYFRRLIFMNDAANRTILLKILKRYGWPCDNDSRKLSTKAWHIAWHTRSNFELLSEFYTYIIQANRASCINCVQLSAIEEQLALVKRVRSK